MFPFRPAMLSWVLRARAEDRLLPSVQRESRRASQGPRFGTSSRRLARSETLGRVQIRGRPPSVSQCWRGSRGRRKSIPSPRAHRLAPLAAPRPPSTSRSRPAGLPAVEPPSVRALLHFLATTPVILLIICVIGASSGRCWERAGIPTHCADGGAEATVRPAVRPGPSDSDA